MVGGVSECYLLFAMPYAMELVLCDADVMTTT